MEGVGGLLEQDHPRHPEGGGRADHGPDVLGVLERHEQGAALGPARLGRPGRHLGHSHQEERRSSPGDVEVPEERVGEAEPGRPRRGLGRGRPFGVGEPAFDPIREATEDLGDHPRAGDQGPGVLADALAGQQVEGQLVGRVRLAGHVTDRTGIRGRRRFRVRRPFESLVDDEPAVVRGAGDLVGPVEHQSEGLGVGCPGLDDLRLAIGPLHEDHPAARLEAVGHPVERLGDRGDRPGDDALDLPGELRPDLAGEDLDVGQLEPGADLFEELGPGPSRFGQDHRDARPGDLERYAGQAGAGAHVDQGGGELDELQDEQAVDIVLEHHVLEVVDACEVQLGVGRAEHPMIPPKLVELRGFERDAAAREDGFERCPTGGHGRVPWVVPGC